MVRKATFVRKYYGQGYDAHMVYFDYEYRGHEYTVCENRAKGNASLSWQHHSAQARIDQLIEQAERCKNVEPEQCRYEDTAQCALDQLYNFFDGEPSDFDIR